MVCLQEVGDHVSLQLLLGCVACLRNVGDHRSLQILQRVAYSREENDRDFVELLLVRVKWVIMFLYAFFFYVLCHQDMGDHGSLQFFFSGTCSMSLENG